MARTKEQQREYYFKNKERIDKEQKDYYLKNKERIDKEKKNYYLKNKERINKRTKLYYEKNRKIRLKYQREYCKKNKEKIRAYRKKNKERRNKRRNKRKLSDFKYILLHNLRNRLLKAFKLYSTTGKIRKSKDYLINYGEIIEHLKPFPKDIENYEIDHIIPLSWFDFNNPKEIEWAFSPENHQWLTAEENLKKSNSYIWVKEQPSTL